MSTVMYCYEISKRNTWKFVEQLKDFYKENGFSPKKLHENIKDGKITMHEVLETLNNIKDDVKVELQLFDNGRTWIIRILESGYLFMNKQEAYFPELKQLFYDDRADKPDDISNADYAKNAIIAEWVDSQLQERHYMIIPITDINSMLDEIFKLQAESNEHEN